jgi:hypothetical protein
VNRFLKLVTSKTVLGAAGGVASWLATLPVIDAKHVIGGASAVLGVAGVRDAIDKAAEMITRSK